ncbi:hypothetical protein SBA4_2150018 [Candidatus Sulfopaludibacter sp. SbA4]|nr:hypothetical protein SBA4_2150018 [Candidatus Sulfopaludibacter sp. SbA4]
MRTAPYMHDGSLATLEEVVEYYDRGGNRNPGLDNEIRPLHLTSAKKQNAASDVGKHQENHIPRVKLHRRCCRRRCSPAGVDRESNVATPRPHCSPAQARSRELAPPSGSGGRGRPAPSNSHPRQACFQIPAPSRSAPL